MDDLPGEILDWVAQKMVETGTPGVSISIFQDSAPTFTKTIGLRDVANQLPITPETVFRVGSISKLFTTLAFLTLWNQGKVGLDDEVNNYLPGFKIKYKDANSPPVTFRHLLTHRSGIRDLIKLRHIFNRYAGGGVPIGAKIPTWGEMYAGGVPCEIYPDQKFAYCNHAFVLIGVVIEEITGKCYADYVRELILTPTHMNDSSFERAEINEDLLAKGYNWKGREIRDSLSTVGPAGGLFSTTPDLAKFGQMLLAGGINEAGELVVEKRAIDAAWNPVYRPDPKMQGYGLGFMLKDVGGHPLVYHGGLTWGFISQFFLAPEDQVGVVVLANGSRFAPEDASHRIFKELVGVEDLHPEITKVPQNIAKQICGEYGPFRGGVVTNTRFYMGFGGYVKVSRRRDGNLYFSAQWTHKKGDQMLMIDRDDPLHFLLENNDFAFQKQVGFNILEENPASKKMGVTLLPYLFGPFVAQKRSWGDHVRSLPLKMLLSIGGKFIKDTIP